MLRTARGLTALTIVVLAVLLPPLAHAATVSVLTTGSVGGANVAVGDIVNGTLKPGTQARFVTMPGGATGVFCSMSGFSATVVSNPPAGGIAILSLTGLTIGGVCTSNLPGLSLQAITVGGMPYTITVDGSTKVVTITGKGSPILLTFRFGSVFGSLSCAYRPTNGVVSGMVSNTDSSVTFTNQQFTKVSGSSLCPANLYYSATYILVDVTAGSLPIFIQ